MRKAFALLLTSLIVLLTISLMFTSVVAQSDPPCYLYWMRDCGDIYQEGKTMECYQYRIREETSDHSDRHFYTIWKFWEEEECTLNCTSCIIVSTGQGYTWECFWVMKSCSGEWYLYKAEGKSYCYDGYGNCDEDWSNGCEVNLKTDSKNCGSCGNDCDVKDGWYCNEANDHNYYYDYYCANSKCDSYHITQSKNCNDYDGWHCAGGGEKRQKWDGYCEQGSLLVCDYDVLVEEDCDDYDSPCCLGNSVASCDYSCVGGSCFLSGILCSEDEECVDGECQEVTPEFSAGVTAVFGATLFIFLMMRRKYVRK